MVFDKTALKLMTPDDAAGVVRGHFACLLRCRNFVSKGNAVVLSGLMLTFLVGLAGACGALSRYLLGRFIAERVSAQFPLGTLIINVSGAFVIGVLFALAGHKVINPAVQLVFATGYLGGFTTFSTMSWEGVQLVRGGNTGIGFLYLGGSLLLGLIAAMAGIALGGLL
jgi:CrcB protein